jgi:hypothetical protein
MKRISVIAAVVVAICISQLPVSGAERFSYEKVDRPGSISLPLRIDDIALSSIFFHWNAAHEADTLLLSCMDFRLITSVERYMDKNSKHDHYDYIELAGAALGVNNTTYPEWGLSFWEHVQIARDLHNIKNIMVIDHRNCGAYKVLLNQDFPEEATKAQLAEETASHKKQLDLLASAIHTKYPYLGVQTRLMALDGSVLEIGDTKGTGAFPAWPTTNH